MQICLMTFSSMLLFFCFWFWKRLNMWAEFKLGRIRTAEHHLVSITQAADRIHKNHEVCRRRPRHRASERASVCAYMSPTVQIRSTCRVGKGSSSWTETPDLTQMRQISADMGNADKCCLFLINVLFYQNVLLLFLTPLSWTSLVCELIWFLSVHIHRTFKHLKLTDSWGPAGHMFRPSARPGDVSSHLFPPAVKTSLNRNTSERIFGGKQLNKVEWNTSRNRQTDL